MGTLILCFKFLQVSYSYIPEPVAGDDVQNKELGNKSVLFTYNELVGH